jgi:probable rRNA maturation factor
VEGTRIPGGRARLRRDLGRLAGRAATLAGREVDLVFAVVSDAAIRDLNRRSLGHDWTTDVLSFPMGDEEGCLRGEVVLSADTARQEAARRNVDPYHELMLYAVHGVLHLLGHDDHAPRERRRMRRAEREVLGALRLPTTFAARGDRGTRRSRS